MAPWLPRFELPKENAMKTSLCADCRLKSKLDTLEFSHFVGQKSEALL